MLSAGSTVNITVHHLATHNFVSWNNITGSVRDPARPSLAGATMYILITLTHLHYHFYQQSLLVGAYMIHSKMIINRFRQTNRPDIFQHDVARPHKTGVTTHFLAQNNVNILHWPALSAFMNPIEHIWDELGWRTRSNHQINMINDSNIHFC